MSYSLHRGAEQDLAEAFRFYRREGGAGLARRFLGEQGDTVVPVTVHATSRQQITYRLRSGRFQL